MTAAIAVNGVSKRFRIPLDRSTTLKYRMVHPRSSSRFHDLLALDDVSFAVPSGQFVGIIGHNGCGKSTLLKILSRIYQPTRGTVDLVGHVSPFLELGVGFNPELSARENVYLNGAVLGLTRSELDRRIDEIITFSELDDFVDQKVKNFSSGMQVRLAFAVAIQAHAAILLMDEVLAVGDARFQAKCFDVFMRYKREGKTVVLVTHDLGAVDQYCDRAILMDHGRVIADGSAPDVTAQYRRLVGQQSDADAVALTGAVATGSGEGTQDDDRRWGTGEAVIRAVELLDDRGDNHHTFATGGAMTIRVTYEVLREVAEFVCGIGVHRADGYIVAGTNTFIERLPMTPAPVGTVGIVEYRIPSLSMLTGTYLLTVELSSHLYHAYDHMEQAFEFRVMDESGRAGLFDLGGGWRRVPVGERAST